MRRRAILGAMPATLASAMFAGVGRAAAAVAYPDRPIRLIVPFIPGGPNDILARLLAQHLYESLGQTIVVENIGGGSTITGSRVAARAAADGYTLLMVSPSHVINPGLRATMPFDVMRDFVPVIELAESPNVLVVNPASPIRTVADLLAMAKANPGKIDFGSGGIGTATHLAGELLDVTGGVKMTHVPYKGDAQATTDLLAGRIAWKFGTIFSAMPLLQAHQLRAIAVSGSRRVAALPEVPTVAETLPGFDATSLYGVVAPAGTPQEIVLRLNAAIGDVLKLPEVMQLLARDGGVPIGGTPQALGAVLQANIDKWRKVIRNAGIQPE